MGRVHTEIQEQFRFDCTYRTIEVEIINHINALLDDMYVFFIQKLHNIFHKIILSPILLYKQLERLW